jgi:hypothetical protein
MDRIGRMPHQDQSGHPPVHRPQRRGTVELVPKSRGTGGTATVTCSSDGQPKTTTTTVALSDDRAGSEASRPVRRTGCERDGERWVGALFLCATHAQEWPRTWGEL